MKVYISIILVLTLGFACKMTNSEREPLTSDIITSKTKIEFEEEVFDFGQMTQGEKVSFEFKFENIGDAPLLILSVKPSCGCTVSEDWPDYPIEPGGAGVIPVEFNSEGKSGHQSKSITLVSNTDPRTTVLMIEGDIIAPELND
ncbi:MAG: DUF1573 domain-containing protein [Flavobacteriales bacterium]|nr:DUF1573 domain-containing protein [Flavobacteriales bacterium]